MREKKIAVVRCSAPLHSSDDPPSQQPSLLAFSAHVQRIHFFSVSTRHSFWRNVGLQQNTCLKKITGTKVRKKITSAIGHLHPQRYATYIPQLVALCAQHGRSRCRFKDPRTFLISAASKSSYVAAFEEATPYTVKIEAWRQRRQRFVDPVQPAACTTHHSHHDIAILSILVAV